MEKGRFSAGLVVQCCFARQSVAYMVKVLLVTRGNFPGVSSLPSSGVGVVILAEIDDKHVTINTLLRCIAKQYLPPQSRGALVQILLFCFFFLHNDMGHH